jgi:hypothetical protein
MSINSCTVDMESINGFCGKQRSKMIALLRETRGINPPVYIPDEPIVPPAVIKYGGSGGVAPRFIPRMPEPLSREFPVEQPIITVSAEIFGIKGFESLEVTSRLDFVIVTDLEVTQAITIEISQMEI